MSDFAPFIEKFNKYKENANLKYTHNESKMYGWRFSDDVKRDFSSHLPNEWPDAPDDIKANFNSMFEKEHDLMGIQVIGSCSGKTIYLLKATEKKKTFSLSSFACFGSNDIYTPSKLTCPVTNKQFNWPISIKMGSFYIKDSLREYYDTSEKVNWGLITFDMDKYQLDDVYVSGKINYKTGLVLFERYTKTNEEQYDDLLSKQAATSSGTDSSGNSSSGNNSPAPTIIYEKDVDDIQIEFVVYENPVKVVWQYTIGE